MRMFLPVEEGGPDAPAPAFPPPEPPDAPHPTSSTASIAAPTTDSPRGVIPRPRTPDSFVINLIISINIAPGGDPIFSGLDHPTCEDQLRGGGRECGRRRLRPRLAC